MVFAAALVFSVALICSAYLIQRSIALASQQHAQVHSESLTLTREVLQGYTKALENYDRLCARQDAVVDRFLKHIEDTQVIGGQPVRLAQETLELDAEAELARRGAEQIGQVTSFARRRAQDMANKIVSQHG